MNKQRRQTIKILVGIGVALISLSLQAQTQVVKGKVIDATAEYELIGATIQLLDHEPLLGTVTDINGAFRLQEVPVGRQNFSVSYVGYKTITLPNVLITSGKEVVLTVKLEESVESLQTVVVTAEADKDMPINEMAKVSARTFSLEEVTRFSGGRNDVARLATSFAGVSAPNDSRNDIVVRGNSPNGLLWRVEGLPIATTNHFATLGTTGGPVNALNTNLLRTSDFLTGAFPAEYGNANAAVFDVQFRNGNTDTYEFTGQMGFNGAEFMTEGPLNRKDDGSFLISYRYGIASVAATGTSAVPYYQDLSFKVNLGTGKLGKFELFGLGGLSHIDFLSDETNENDLFADPNSDSYVNNQLGLAGISHLLRLNKKGFIKTVMGISGNGNEFLQDNYLRDSSGNKTNKYRVTEVDNLETRYTLSSTLHQKYNAQWSLKTGVLAELYRPSYSTRDRNMRIDLPDTDNDGIPDEFVTVTDMTEIYSLTQAFAQAEYKFTDRLSTTFGLHSQYFDVNNKAVVEPRAAISWQYKPQARLSMAYGMHAQTAPAPILFYETEVSPGILERTNADLDFSKSHHFVLGYDQSIGNDWRFKAETYYQSLYDLPVEATASSYSVLNEGADFAFNERANLVNKGKGTNYGIEATLEKFFSNNYYLLMTTSIYESTYEGSDGVERSTAFNNSYVFNLLGGREWLFGKHGQNALTFDTKLTTAGGKPYTPVDLDATRSNGGREVRDESMAFSENYGDYFRWDVKLGYRINKPGRKISQQFYVDLQNITNRQNEFVKRYNSVTDEVNLITQIGFFPDVMYRIQF